MSGRDGMGCCCCCCARAREKIERDSSHLYMCVCMHVCMCVCFCSTQESSHLDVGHLEQRLLVYLEQGECHAEEGLVLRLEAVEEEAIPYPKSQPVLDQ